MPRIPVLALLAIALVCHPSVSFAVQAIAVLPLAGEGVPSGELGALSFTFRTSLLRQLASTHQGVFGSIPEQRTAQFADCFSLDCALEAAEATQAAFVVMGRVSGSGYFRTVEAALVDVRRGMATHSVVRACHFELAEETVAGCGLELAAAISGVPAETAAVRRPLHAGKPPLSAGRVAAELAIGIGTGVELAIVGAYMFSDPHDMENDAEPFGILAGYVLGSALGVYVIGNTGDQTGSAGWTLLGSAVGMWPFFSPITATIAFNLTRHWDDVRVEEHSIIGVPPGRSAQTGFAAPGPPRAKYRSRVPMVNVFSIRFAGP